MKEYLLILFLFPGLNVTLYGQNQMDSIRTKVIHVHNMKEAENLSLDFCDTFSLEITGLYRTLRKLPALVNDSTFIKKLLIKNGFNQVDWGSGNWDLGPRFLYLKFVKDTCTCRTFKKYYYAKKKKNGYYDLRISERIICNSDKLMNE